MRHHRLAMTSTHGMTLISIATKLPSIIPSNTGSSDETLAIGKGVQEKGAEVNTRQQQNEMESVAIEDTQKEE
ncbi:hypothetical protein CHS0354_021043 [Potamilus streckersoni]|uniref:Uncharacterized protein n=1 Tax=Potamilus streckersoni TaxID=2493646 RepID=A0AAE0VTR0_9BIVA|nr:hypothetical protein CHS0354_021043 [Potamilus streckersoni]